MKVTIDEGVFNDAYLGELDNFARTQIIFGGAASGKSVFKAQQCVVDIMSGGRNYLVCRQVGSTVRKSVFAEIKKAIFDFGVQSLFPEINKSAGVITCSNGSQVLFSGLDDAEKIKSITPAQGVLTDIWVEEATETDKRTIQAIYKRQRGGSGRAHAMCHVVRLPEILIAAGSHQHNIPGLQRVPRSFQRLPHEIPFHRFERDALRGQDDGTSLILDICRGPAGGFTVELGRKAGSGDHLFVRKKEDALQDVAQLTRVAGPLVLFEGPQSVDVEMTGRETQLPAQMVEEV